MEDEVDAVIIPYVEDLQYTIPLHTNVKVYEIWMKYRFRLVTMDAIHDHGNGELTYSPNQSLADWTLKCLRQDTDRLFCNPTKKRST